MVGPYPATWVWLKVVDPTGVVRRSGSTPAGVALDHGDHAAFVLWIPTAETDGAAFTVDSLLPLTVVEPVTCEPCGVTAMIEAGAWTPTEGGERG